MASLFQTLFDFARPTPPATRKPASPPPVSPVRAQKPLEPALSRPLQTLEPAPHAASGAAARSSADRTALASIFQRAYRDLRPRAPMPPFDVRFRRFTSLNTTIRLREGKLSVNLSDLLQEAPQPVLEAIAHILIAKLYRKPVLAAYNDVYRTYTGSPEISHRAQQVRQQRGRKRVLSAKGKVYDLDEVFDAINTSFFNSELAKPTLTWSGHSARRLLGHYDAAHNTIVVSRIFDRPQVPRFAIDYLMYHEMLHLKHPVRMNGSRRCVHSREFKLDEAKFPDFEKVKAYLKRL